MSNNIINIRIIDSSYIIYEGLANIISDFDNNIEISKINNLEDIYEIINDKENIDIILINPALIINKTKEFKKIKRLLPKVSWIGLIYSFFDNEIISSFNETISINESPQHIYNILEKYTNNNTERSFTDQHDSLSEREKDVLIQLVNGLSNKEIADKLNISTHTVISHRKNITLKTGIKSQSGLTIYAITKNIISLDNVG